ncbi:MAG TPA: hypothetical protein PK910_07705, partial [Bacteroidales bacterium]|nr:hypothetical protein [Bacteroidales bacterium]HRC89885.1 hypothetical protein [Bacteroidales bacterium]
QIDEYFNKYYIKLWERNKKIAGNNFEKAREIAAWKKKMTEEWDKIEVLNYNFGIPPDNFYKAGHEYKAEIFLNINNIPKENMGVEYVLAQVTKSGEYEFIASREFSLVSCKGGKCLYRTHITPEKAGAFLYGIRIFPKHPDLTHKQDFYLLRWID